MASKPVLETAAPIGATALFLLIFASTFAPGAAAQEQEGVWLVNVDVEASVCHDYATVEVSAHIRNRGPDPEFPFIVQVPAGALVSNLTIVRDGEVHHATIEERAAAREAYEEHKSQEMTGGLVEKRRGSQAFAYLINVAAFEEVRATLRYEHYIAAERGVYSLPLEAPVSGFGQDMGASFQVSFCEGDVLAAWTEPGTPAEGSDGQTIFRHGVGPRPTDDSTPFDVHFTHEATGVAGDLVAQVIDGQGYFAHRFRPDVDADRLPADVVLALDISGSMSGDKVQQMQDAARQLVASLEPTDRLHVVFFSSGVEQPWPGLRYVTDDNRSLALEAVDEALAAGGTDIEAALGAAYEALAGATGDPERMPLVMLLSDGRASVTEGMRSVVSSQADEGVRLFTIAFGGDADWSLLHGLAAHGGGVAEHVETGAGAEADLGRFMSTWAAPVLREVNITYAGGIDALVRDTDVLFVGSEILVVGTFDPELDVIEGSVQATSPDGPVDQSFSFALEEAQGHGFLERLVAHRQVEVLQDEVAAGGGADVLAELVALALEHSFVTDHTSLVLLLEESGPPDERVVVAGAAGAGQTWTSSATTIADTSSSRMRMTTTSPDVDHMQLRDSRSSSGDGSGSGGRGDDAGADTPMPGGLAVLALLVAVVWLARSK